MLIVQIDKDECHLVQLHVLIFSISIPIDAVVTNWLTLTTTSYVQTSEVIMHTTDIPFCNYTTITKAQLLNEQRFPQG